MLQLRAQMVVNNRQTGLRVAQRVDDGHVAVVRYGGMMRLDQGMGANH